MAIRRMTRKTARREKIIRRKERITGIRDAARRRVRKTRSVINP